MANNSLAPHEILELRELLSTGINEYKKLQTSLPLVKDEELKSFMEKCSNSKMNKISTLQGFIENSADMK